MCAGSSTLPVLSRRVVFVWQLQRMCAGVPVHSHVGSCPLLKGAACFQQACCSNCITLKIITKYFSPLHFRTEHQQSPVGSLTSSRVTQHLSWEKRENKRHFSESGFPGVSHTLLHPKRIWCEIINLSPRQRDIAVRNRKVIIWGIGCQGATSDEQEYS